MRSFTSKIIPLSLASIMVLMSIGSISLEPSKNINQKQIQRNVKLYSNRVQDNKLLEHNPSKEFINLMEPYVYIENGEYKISSQIYQNKNINSTEILRLKKMLAKANEIAIKSHTQNKLNIKNGTEVLANTQPTYNENSYIAIVGQTKIVYFWWGVYVYLNNVDTMWLEGLTTVAACSALSVLFPGIGGIVAGGIASLVATGCGIYSPLVQDGCVISYNYIEGPQDIWAQ